MIEAFGVAVGQVALAALLLGAGLPALFALGVRALVPASADGAHERAGRPAPGRRALAVLCFALVILAVAVGLLTIIATGFGLRVEFAGLLPALVEK